MDALKKAQIRPLYIKDGRTEKSNYRSISVFSNVSKIYERYLYDQIRSDFDKTFSSVNAVFEEVLGATHLFNHDRKNEKKIPRVNKQFCAANLTLNSYLTIYLLQSWMQIILIKNH